MTVFSILLLIVVGTAVRMCAALNRTSNPIYDRWIAPADVRSFLQFGRSLAIQDRFVFISSGVDCSPRSKVLIYEEKLPQFSDRENSSSVFHRFKQISRVESEKGIESDFNGFGSVIKLSRHYAAISAPKDNRPMFQSGRVYLFDLKPLHGRSSSASTLTPLPPPVVLQSPIAASRPDQSFKEKFGSSLDLFSEGNAHFLAVGAPGLSSGAVYLFVSSDRDWPLMQTIQHPLFDNKAAVLRFDQFGTQLQFFRSSQGDVNVLQLAISAPEDSLDVKGLRSGAVHFYQLQSMQKSKTFTFVSSIFNPELESSSKSFGHNLHFSGDTGFVAAEISTPFKTSGVVYCYERSSLSDSFVLKQTLFPASSDFSSDFGSQVLSNRKAVSVKVFSASAGEAPDEVVTPISIIKHKSVSSSSDLKGKVGKYLRQVEHSLSKSPVADDQSLSKEVVGSVLLSDDPEEGSESSDSEAGDENEPDDDAEEDDDGNDDYDNYYYEDEDEDADNDDDRDDDSHLSLLETVNVSLSLLFVSSPSATFKDAKNVPIMEGGKVYVYSNHREIIRAIACQFVENNGSKAISSSPLWNASEALLLENYYQSLCQSFSSPTSDADLSLVEEMSSSEPFVHFGAQIAMSSSFSSLMISSPFATPPLTDSSQNRSVAAGVVHYEVDKVDEIISKLTKEIEETLHNYRPSTSTPPSSGRHRRGNDVFNAIWQAISSDEGVIVTATCLPALVLTALAVLLYLKHSPASAHSGADAASRKDSEQAVPESSRSPPETTHETDRWQQYSYFLKHKAFRLPFMREGSYAVAKTADYDPPTRPAMTTTSASSAAFPWGFWFHQKYESLQENVGLSCDPSVNETPISEEEVEEKIYDAYPSPGKKAISSRVLEGWTQNPLHTPVTPASDPSEPESDNRTIPATIEQETLLSRNTAVVGEKIAATASSMAAVVHQFMHSGRTLGPAANYSHLPSSSTQRKEEYELQEMPSSSTMNRKLSDI